MNNLDEIIKKIENYAPPSLASEWDNSGWQIFLGNNTVNKVLIALTPTLEVINQAIDKKCDLIICHHPLLFEKINKISVNNHLDQVFIKAIQNNIQIYSAHTNLDTTRGGIGDRLAEIFELENIEIIENFIRVGSLKREELTVNFIKLIKDRLNIEKIKIINPDKKKTVKKVAVCPGSGADLIDKLPYDVDIYITADIKYHQAIEVKNLTVADAGHYETERIILPVIKDLISSPELEVIIADETSPWNIL